MTKRGLLVVFSGPSGVGKDTILRHFLSTRKDCVLSISATTRAPRAGEYEGGNYYFITREQFDEQVKNGSMLEYAEFSGNYYGTPAAPVEQRRREGLNVILEIEVQGAMKIKREHPDAIMIFVMPPSIRCLRERLTTRGTETPEAIERRLAAARTEILHVHEYDFVIFNHSVEECARQLGVVMDAAKYCAKSFENTLLEECTDA